MNLTKRELEIMELVSQGLNNKEICEKLNIKIGNLRVQLSNIYKKLKIDDIRHKFKKSKAIAKYTQNCIELFGKIKILTEKIIEYNKSDIFYTTEIDILANKILKLLV